MKTAEIFHAMLNLEARLTYFQDGFTPENKMKLKFIQQYVTD